MMYVGRSPELAKAPSSERKGAPTGRSVAFSARRAWLGALFGAVLASAPGCAGCAQPGVADAGDAGDGDGDGTSCTTDLECGDGRICELGVCVTPATGDGDGDGDINGDGDGDGDSGVDAGPDQGVLAVTPGTELEFGAQLIGVPVNRTVQLNNIGTQPVNIAAIILDDDSGEFDVDVSGTVQEILDVGDTFSLNISHTPTDGVPDEAEVTILHDGLDNLITLSLFAEFKGNAELSVTADATAFAPNITELDVGEADPVLGLDAAVFVRNTGAPDSVLTITNLTLTPQNAGFTIDAATLDALPELMDANSNHLCAGGDVSACGAPADACTDMVCLDATGYPLAGLAVPLHFEALPAPSQATLSIEIQDANNTYTHEVLLSGRPTQPQIAITPATVAFGTVLVGAPSPSTTVTVENVGLGPLHLTLVELPAADAYDVVPESPVPTQMGHVPVVLAQSETFTFATTFTPTENGMTNDVLSLHTNDAENPIVNVSLTGTGLQCQANAEVDASGECVCLPGFNACGEACIADGPTSCGTSCTDCTAYIGAVGTDAQCEVGSCAFTCQEAWYDVDADLGSDFTDGGFSGCEYLCPQNPALGFELCNGVDDNCEGSVDEGLPPDTDDLSTQGNTCANAVVSNDQVPAVGDNPLDGGERELQRTLYPTADNDWFRIVVAEGDGSPGCIEEIPCLEGGTEQYRTLFEVASPSNASFTLDVFVPDTFEITGSPNRTQECSGGQTLSGVNVVHNWTRDSNIGECLLCGLGFYCYPGGYGCAFDDYQVYYVRVRPDDSDPDNFSCEPYTLTVTAHGL